MTDKMIIHKTGSRDFVSGLHEFLLVHLLSFRKVNLPACLFFYFHKDASRKGKKKVIPFGAMLKRVMNTQGIMQLLETYEGADKANLSRKILQVPIGKANIQKMNLTTVKSFLAEKERTLKKVLTAEEEEQKEVIRKRIVEINAKAHKEQPDNVASTTIEHFDIRFERLTEEHK